MCTLCELAADHDVVFVDAPVQEARPLAEQGDLAVAVRDRFQRAGTNGHAEDDMVATCHARFAGQSPAIGPPADGS